MAVFAAAPKRAGKETLAFQAGSVRAGSHAGFERWLPWLVFVLGFATAVRYPSVNASPGESGKAAITLLNLGYIGNPYILPTGPTAHVSPILACLLAGVYWACGENSSLARIVLGVVAAWTYALSVRAVLRICATSGLGRRAIWIACGLLVVLPMFLFRSVVSYRQWDQPYGAFILVQGWLVFETSRHSDRPYRSELQMAAWAGLGVLFSPAIFPALAASLAMMVWMRRRLGDVRLSVLASGVVIAACLLPWAVRNKVELGTFILTRSNFGLELATGNAPGATGVSGSGSGRSLHPHDSIATAAQVQSVGEVAYMQRMTEQAEAWIIADPARFLRLTAARVRLAFFPSKAIVGWVPGMGMEWPWVLCMVFGALRVAALIGAILFRIRPVSVALYTFLPLAPYFITHVNMRYESTVFFTSIVAIAFVSEAALSAAGRSWRRAVRYFQPPGA